MKLSGCISHLWGLTSVGTLCCGERTALRLKLFPNSLFLWSDFPGGISTLRSWNDSSEMSCSGGDSLHIIFQSGQVLLRPSSSIHGSSLCSNWEFKPGWETGSPSRTRFLDFSGILSLYLSLGAGTGCLQPSWVKATVTLLKNMEPWGPAVRRSAAIPSSPVLSSWGRVGSGEDSTPSSSIWVPPSAAASEQSSERQRRSAAASAPTLRDASSSPASPLRGRVRAPR